MDKQTTDLLQEIDKDRDAFINMCNKLSFLEEVNGILPEDCGDATETVSLLLTEYTSDLSDEDKELITAGLEAKTASGFLGAIAGKLKKVGRWVKYANDTKGRLDAEVGDLEKYLNTKKDSPKQKELTLSKNSLKKITADGEFEDVAKVVKEQEKYLSKYAGNLKIPKMVDEYVKLATEINKIDITDDAWEMRVEKFNDVTDKAAKFLECTFETGAQSKEYEYFSAPRFLGGSSLHYLSALDEEKYVSVFRYLKFVSDKKTDTFAAPSKGEIGEALKAVKSYAEVAKKINDSGFDASYLVSTINELEKGGKYVMYNSTAKGVIAQGAGILYDALMLYLALSAYSLKDTLTALTVIEDFIDNLEDK